MLNKLHVSIRSRVHRFLLSVSLIFLRMTTTILLSESKTGLKLLRFGLNQHRLKKNNHTSSILVCLEMICPSNIKIKPVHPPPQKYFMHHSFSSGFVLFRGFQLFECFLTGHGGRFVSVRGGPTDSSPEFDGQEVECDSPDNE